MTKITIEIENIKLFAELNNTSCAQSILKDLPFSSLTSTWGDEIYCMIPTKHSLENDAKEVLEIGQIGYWPSGPAFCIFFGPTPMSIDNEPRAASKVNVIGKLDQIDMKLLKSVKSNSSITIKLSH